MTTATLPSFDAFLQSARRTPAMLPGTGVFLRSVSCPSLPSIMTDSPASPSSYYPSYQCYTPPGSPAYGHFVSLSPTSSVESFTETWPSSEEEERTPQSYFQEMMYRPIAPEYLKPTPRNVQAKPKARHVRKKYLKERQRCEILRRVRAGERQAHLAKEFGVSRAAVCYLLKHETEILCRSAARHQRPSANWHPWK